MTLMKLLQTSKHTIQDGRTVGLSMAMQDLALLEEDQRPYILSTA